MEDCFLHNFQALSIVSTIFGKLLIVNSRLFLFSLILVVNTMLYGQDSGILEGNIRDSIGEPVDLATISLQGTQEGTVTSAD